MAGERKGKAYEALTKLILEDLQSKNIVKGTIFWDEKPEKMTIKPDLTIGKDKNDPQIVLLITHSGSAKNSDMKFWRNMGELAEAKIFLPTQPKVFNLAFDSVIKENLKKAQAASFDGQLIVGDLSYGNDLQKWIDQNLDDFPKDKDEKVDFLRDKRKSDPELKRICNLFRKDLKALLAKTAPAVLNGVWQAERKRPAGVAPTAKETFVRRGFIKALLVNGIPDKQGSLPNIAAWMERLGLARKVIGKYRVQDDDLLWVTKNMNLSFPTLTQLSNKVTTKGFWSQVDKVKEITLLPILTEWIENNYNDLVTTNGMLNCLQNQHLNPGAGLNIPAGIKSPKNVWIFDVVGSISKAYFGKSQGFGYSTFSKHRDAKKSKVGTMWLGDWCSCFFNQYVSRKETFNPDPSAIKFVAKILSEELSKVPLKKLSNLADKIEEKYIVKEYEATLLAHRGYEPLLGLLIQGDVSGSIEKLRSCFGERAKLTGQATKTTVLKAKKTLINWQSCSDAGRDHKKKELCGRAVALRYSWDDKNQKFIKRPGVEKLILLVDGTWSQSDLNALARAGWDAIFYPDQITQLKAAVV